MIKRQQQTLEQQVSDLQSAKMMCEKILSSGERVPYEEFTIEQYVTDQQKYWRKNSPVFKLDSVSFFFIWGEEITWGIITVFSLVVAMLSISHLPAEIPIQWNGGMGSAFVDKVFIFAFPVACVIIRFLLRPFIWRWLKMRVIDGDSVTDYIANYLCFIALSVEIFIILYVNGIVKHVTTVLFIDTVLLIGLLLLAIFKSTRNKQESSE